jgi:hypothetical protein
VVADDSRQLVFDNVASRPPENVPNKKNTHEFELNFDGNTCAAITLEGVCSG